MAVDLYFMKNARRYEMKVNRGTGLYRALALLTAIMLCAGLLTACGGGDSYDDYAAAYNRVTANGGMDADLSATLKMDGTTTRCSGNFKVDTKSNILYYQMTSGNDTITQFSDGSYLYTEQGGYKTKYALNSKPSQSSAQDKQGRKDSSGSVFNTDEFLQEFSSFLEAGKIRELGLLSPIAKAVVTKTGKSGNTYTLQVADSLVKTYLNTLAANESGSGDTIQLTELNDFNYSATAENDLISSVTYSGTIAVNVPASLMASGEAADYELEFSITASFNNPGSEVSIDLPSADGYTEV